MIQCVLRNEVLARLFSLGLLFLAAAAQGAWETPVTGAEQLELKGLGARITYQVVDEKKLTISGLDSITGWSWHKEGENIFVEQTLPSSRAELRSKVNPAKDLPQVVIRGPSLNTEVYLQEGTFAAAQMKSPLRVQLKKGRVVLQKNQSSVKLIIQTGQVDVQEQLGNLDVKMFSGAIAIKKIMGDVKIEGYQPEVNASEGRGRISWKSYDGKVRIDQWTGNVQINQSKGSFVLSAFEGQLDGEVNEGSYQLAIKAASEVRLKSQKARIAVQLPTKSGAALNLATTLGELATPKEVRVYRTAKEKFAKGRLPGGDQKILVSIRAEDGSITVK